MKILLVLVSLSLLFGILLYPIHAIWGSNLYVFHFFTLLEYSLLTFIFSKWQKIEWFKKALRISILIFAVIWILSKLWIEDFSSTDNYTSSIANTLLVGISAYTMLSLLQDNIETLFMEHRFWISSGVLIYYGGSLFTIALSNALQSITKTEATVMWGIHNVLFIAANLCYTGGFLSLRRR